MSKHSARRCSDCGEVKPVDQFGKNSMRKDGLRSECRVCCNRREAERRQRPGFREARREYMRQRRQADPRGSWYINLRARHPSMTPEVWDATVIAQGGRCALCEEPADLVVDHDHACCPTRARSCEACVRGLLCAPCNKGLGHFADDLARLRAAIKYLEA